jgi:hypothetical protein
MKIIDHIVQSIQSLSEYNSQVEKKPHVILWTDEDRQWESVLQDLLNKIPELFVLGNYDKLRTGPSIWLRCVIAGKIEGINIPEDKVPILYLPGVSRSKIRAVESCEKSLKPLAELQYRGKIWSQINSKDWTVASFLENKEKGLGLTVSKDQDTKNYLLLSLSRLLYLEKEDLDKKTIQKEYLQSLIIGDPSRDVLSWLNSPENFKNNSQANEWASFQDLMREKFGVDVVREGELTGAKKFLERKGNWDGVWKRYLDSYPNFPEIKELLKKVPTPNLGLFFNASEYGMYYKWNFNEESKLKNEFLAISELSRADALIKIEELEKNHKERRSQIWFLLNESPYVNVLEYLYQMSVYSKKNLKLPTIDEMAKQYSQESYLVDSNLLKALTSIFSTEMEKAVFGVIKVIYEEWANESAGHLQSLFLKNNPKNFVTKMDNYQDGEVVFFVDGLRLDTARLLIEKLSVSSYKISEKKCWAVIPSVTSSGKVAVSPISHLIGGIEGNKDFIPSILESEQILNQYHFYKLLKENGWEILTDSQFGTGNGRGWMEFGNIDSQGHHLKWELAKQIDPLLTKIKERIFKLLESGWKKVRIVTDHGWLLLPTGLPKRNLPEVFVDTLWARCAIIKQNQTSSEDQYPWHWNPKQMIALSYGITCYQKNEQYVHGGLSLQESLTLEITIEGNYSPDPVNIFKKIRWVQSRCEIETDPSLYDKIVDIRLYGNDPQSSIVNKLKKINKNGSVFFVIEDDELINREVMIVILDENQKILSQKTTVVGEK